MSVLDELREALAEGSRGFGFLLHDEAETVAALLDIAEAARRVEAGGRLLDTTTGLAQVDKQPFSGLLDALARLDKVERAS